jgi:hypothetical protein
MQGSKAKSKVLIVLMTKALFASRPCLKEIAAAIDKGLTIIPLRLEEDLPRGEDQWPMKDDEDDDEFELERIKVVEKINKLNCLPARGTFFEDASAIKTLTEIVAVSCLCSMYMYSVDIVFPFPFFFELWDYYFDI